MTAPTEPLTPVGWDDVTDEDFVEALLNCQEQLKQARDDAAELRAALKRIHTMFSSTIGDSTAELNRKLVLKVPYAMGIARQALEKTSDAALAATEGQP